MKGRRRVSIVVLSVVVVGIAAGYLLLRPAGSPGDLVASGTVEATETRLGFEVPGRITEIRVREGDEVDRGQELALLDVSGARARRQQAVAQLEAARALLEELESGSRPEEIAQAEAAVDAARDRLADAERDRERSRTLLEGGAISREALDKAEVAARLAAARLDQAEERLKLLERGPRTERVAAQRAAVAQAEAAVEAADSLLADMSLIAATSGLVTIRHREPGEVPAPGSPVLTVVDPGDRWVRIYVPENRLGAVRLGGKATILSDTFPEKRYAGQVIYVAAEAEFTPKTVQTQEERVRLVYAVKVQVLEDPGYELKPGMPVDVVLPWAEEAP